MLLEFEDKSPVPSTSKGSQRVKGRKKGKEARLREADTKVQRRSSLGIFIESQGFIYQRLRKFRYKGEANGTWWNAMEL